MRNRTLDMVKAICAYAVVLLHVHFPGNAGIIANVLARFAVPMFFMVSGYFCFRGDDTEFIRTGKKIRHVLKLMIVAFQVKWHLWFLPALLYCYLLFALAARFRICKQAYVLIPVLLLIHFGMEEFSTFLFPEKHFRVMQFRNYLFTGFPFFMLGHLIHRHQEKLEAWFAGKKVFLLYGMAAGGGIASLLEYRYFGKLELFLGSVFMAVGLFLIAIMGKNRKVPELPVAIGQKYAFFIYLFHLCVADILKDVAVAAGIEKNLLYLWMRPVMVCVLVTAVAVMYGYGMRICRK